MKFIPRGDNFTLFICEEIEFDLLQEYLRKILKKIKKYYYHNISGFYEVVVYKNNKFGTIFSFEKNDEIDFIPDLLDLDITINYDGLVYLEFDDIFLINNFNNVCFYSNKFYVDVNDLSLSDFYKLLEFSNVIYGNKLNKILPSLKPVIKC